LALAGGVNPVPNSLVGHADISGKVAAADRRSPRRGTTIWLVMHLHHFLMHLQIIALSESPR